MMISKPVIFWLMVLAFLSGLFFGMAIHSFWLARKRRLEESRDQLPEMIKRKHARQGLRAIKGGKEKE